MKIINHSLQQSFYSNSENISFLTLSIFSRLMMCLGRFKVRCNGLVDIVYRSRDEFCK